MALSSDDFQRVAVSLDDVARALRDNTTALLRGGGPSAGSSSSPGAGVGGGGIAAPGSGAGPAGGGGAVGGGGGGGAEDTAKGMGLSTMGRLLTASSPATGALGSGLGSLLSGGGPGAAVGLAAQGFSMAHSALQSLTNSNAGSNAAAIFAGIASVEAHETPGQAAIRSDSARDIKDHQQNLDRYDTLGKQLESRDPMDWLGQQGKLNQLAKNEGEEIQKATRHVQDTIEPEKRARAFVEQKFGFAIQHGAMETDAGRATAEKLYRFAKSLNERGQSGERALDKMIDDIRAGGGGARPGQAGGNANR